MNCSVFGELAHLGPGFLVWHRLVQLHPNGVVDLGNGSPAVTIRANVIPNSHLSLSLTKENAEGKVLIKLACELKVDLTAQLSS